MEKRKPQKNIKKTKKRKKRKKKRLLRTLFKMGRPSSHGSIGRVDYTMLEHSIRDSPPLVVTTGSLHV